MIDSYFRNVHAETSTNIQPTTKPTPQNKIYYETQLKKTSIFRHPYEKRKWPNYHRYLPQANRNLTIPPLQNPPHQKLNKIDFFHSSK